MQKCRYSLSVLFPVVGVILFTVIAAIIVLNAAIASRTIRRQTYEIMDRVTAMQAQRLQDGLDTVAAHLSSFVYDNGEILTLETSYLYGGDWFSALYRLRNNFNTAVASQLADSYFLYIPAKDIFISDSNTMMTAHLDKLIELTEEYGESSRRWRVVWYEETAYLVYIVRVHNSYVGAWVSVDSALLGNDGVEGQGVQFDLAGQEGTLLSRRGLSLSINDFSAASREGYQTVRLQSGRWLLVSHPISRAEFSLISLVPDASLKNAVNKFLMIVFPIALAAIGILALIFRSVRRTIMQPVTDLTRAIRRFKSNGAEVQVSAVTPLTEMDEMNTAFNEMVKEIRDLKIGVYEEQLLRQNIEIEYLKMQVTPHFLVNCLNTVYQLTEASQPQLTLRMVKGLNCHIRYMLNADVMVSLKQELELVENYVDLSSIRYPGCLALTTDYAPEAMDATVIPLLVLNFVENTVKYEAVLGRHLEIHISTRVEPQEGRSRLYITIWDSGRGFSQDMLCQLSDMPAYIEANRNRHIGISNVFQRAKLIMGECNFSFANRPDAGAEIHIDLPFVAYHTKEEMT